MIAVIFLILSHEHCVCYFVQLDAELDTGVSNVSDTFGNRVLSSTPFFKCVNVEVWALAGVSLSSV